MKIIRLWADTHSTGLFDEEGNYYLQEETTLSDNTWAELQIWVENYDFIIPMSDIKREVYKENINNLDKIGIELLKKIRLEWNKDIITGEFFLFKYYSEGLYKFLDEM